MPTATAAATQDGRKALVYARKYKTSLCRTFMTNGTCEYGTNCSFAHGFEELRRTSALPSQQQQQLQQHQLQQHHIQQHQILQQQPQLQVHQPVDLLSTPNAPKIIKARSASFNHHDSLAQKAPVLNRFASFSHHKDGNDNKAPTSNNLYHTELCRTFATIGFCPYGDSCQFAHGPQQLRKKSQKLSKGTPSNQKEQHPISRRSTFIRDRRTYKTELCRQWQQTGHCDYDSQCQFAHGVEQLRAATDAIVLPPEVNVTHVVPTAIRSISTHQIPAFPADLKSVQITLSPAVTDHSDEHAQQKSVCNPQLFKTAICRTYSQFGSCPYEHKCRFAHGLSDLRPVPRFKSVSSAGPTGAPTTSQIFSAFQKSSDDIKIQRSHSTSPVLYPVTQ